MREATPAFRERGRILWLADLDQFVRRHRPTWILAGGAALLFAGVGAFETGEAPPLTRYAYWVLLTFACGAIGAWALDRFELRSFRGFWRQDFVLALLTITLLMTPLVYVASGLVLNGAWALDRLLDLWGQVLLVATLFFALQLAFAPQRDMRPSPSAAQISLLARLPAHLRQAEIHAVEAQDHYLRVHTDAGSALILMRLSDAIAELPALDGARTHRSWWVARNAVVAARRSHGRATLLLKAGIHAPVSRTYSGNLRRDGWY